MHIVVVDAGRLPAGVDFPLLDYGKYGWEQYPGLTGDDLKERCWRSDVVISLGTPLTADSLRDCYKLRLVVVPAGQALADVEALEQVTLVEVGPHDCSSREGAEAFCQESVAAIQAFLDGLAA